jgi:hypothetical protein
MMWIRSHSERSSTSDLTNTIPINQSNSQLPPSNSTITITSQSNTQSRQRMTSQRSSSSSNSTNTITGSMNQIDPQVPQTIAMFQFYTEYIINSVKKIPSYGSRLLSNLIWVRFPLLDAVHIIFDIISHFLNKIMLHFLKRF